MSCVHGNDEPDRCIRCKDEDDGRWRRLHEAYLAELTSARIKNAVAEEREACAKIVDKEADAWGDKGDVCRMIAKLIRERSD